MKASTESQRVIASLLENFKDIEKPKKYLTERKEKETEKKGKKKKERSK